MGLAVEVGLLASLLKDGEDVAFLNDAFDRINAVLRESGVPEHIEPVELPPLKNRGTIGFPYSSIHYLRRAYAHWRLYPGRPIAPVQPGENPAWVPEVDEFYAARTYHLINHSDADGFYLPIDFAEVIIDKDRIPGTMLGSSQRLLAELVDIAPAIGIPLVVGELANSEAEKINQEADEPEWPPFYKERYVWLTLYDACRLSVAHKTAICFM